MNNLHPIFQQALAPYAPPRAPVTLSTGRVIVHTREPNGSQRATATPGDYSMTPAEWIEYKGARDEFN
jgi:hypothetical protein